ncbi:hypothetical protein PHMEG_00010175 [Phytophthora megakarya]|uniref:Uncharacterized protein n=1 Tax=Phytophthora megakarya TaxID=4795 RepID=A0A225WGU1_9STRA|nr:hypothetical protein PHMEG_00010175 [Phytophthora megakarya]
MCEHHREYQRRKVAERRAAKAPLQLAPRQCKYYAGCGNQRAPKKNGELHSFCQKHRRRQNTTQRDRHSRLKSAVVASPVYSSRLRRRSPHKMVEPSCHQILPSVNSKISNFQGVPVLARPHFSDSNPSSATGRQQAEGIDSITTTTTPLNKCGSSDRVADQTLESLADIAIAEQEELFRRREAEKRFKEKCAAIWAAHLINASTCNQ